jgi:hypothetical protein
MVYPHQSRARRIFNNPAPLHPKRATIATMQIALIAMKLLEIMFFVGLAGSSVVVIISFIEDGKELFGEDE